MLLLSAIVFGGALALYRRWWTGIAAPLPAYVKGGFSFYNLLLGTDYVLFFIPILAFAIYGLAKMAKEDVRARVMLSFVIAVIVFTVAVGGDWMEGWRFLVPITPFLAIGIAALRSELRYAGILLQAGLLIYFTRTLSTGTPLWAQTPIDARYPWTATVCRDHKRDIEFTERLKDEIRTLLKTQNSVTILSVRMGFTPYYAKLEFGDRLEVIDMVGLSDDVLFRNGLTWNQKHPGQRPPWESPAQRAKHTFFRSPAEVIMTKHAQFTRQTLVSEAVNGLPHKPDIVYNVAMNMGYLNQMKGLGYRIAFVYPQSLIASGPFPGQRIESNEVLAVLIPKS